MTDPGKAIVRAARGWVGTRFAHQGRVKRTAQHKGGVDCLGLLVGVAQELDLRGAGGVAFAAVDERDYSHMPDVARLHEVLSGQLLRVDTLAPGDVVMLRVDDRPQHLAIVSDQPSGLGLIHAYAPARAVVEHALDEWWRARVHAAFRVSNSL